MLSQIDCPLCQCHEFLDITNTDIDHHIKKYGSLYEGLKKSTWKVCSQCGFVLQNPRPSLQQLNDFYLHSQYHEDIEFTPESYKPFAEWYFGDKADYVIKKTGLKKASVFDIGFGMGGALMAFQNRGWSTYGVEADKASFNFAKTHFSFDRIDNDILTSQISDEFKVDVVFSNHAFEHFADLDSVMLGIEKILKPGGYVFTCVPTYMKNKSQQSKQWMNSAHYNLFTHRTLNLLMSKKNIKMITYSYNGSWKEIDELWHLGQLNPGISQPVDTLKDSPQFVQFYINYINPLRSLFFWPIYDNWSKKIQLVKAIRRNLNLVFSDPLLLAKKLSNRLKT